MRVGAGPTLNIDFLYFLRQGDAFGTGVDKAAVVAVQNHLQLFNPVGSGVLIAIYRVLVRADAATTVFLTHYNTALTTLEANGRNLLSGAAAAQGQLRSQTNAGTLGTVFRQGYVPANDQRFIGEDWQTVIGAGEGCNLVLLGNNVALTGSFTWVEF